MENHGGRNFLLYLKALVWSCFVSYNEETVKVISQCLETGRLETGKIDPGCEQLQDSHLGKSIDFILQELPRPEDRRLLSQCLLEVKDSEAAINYQNMVFEMGHYVTAKDAIGDVPEDAPGVVYFLEPKKVSVIFRKPDRTISAHQVYPYEVMPVYTLTIPDPSA